MEEMSGKTISGYEDLCQIYESSSTTVFRARRSGDRQPVIIKVLDSPNAADWDITRYFHEYEITHGKDLKNVVMAIEIVDVLGFPAIVFEDMAGDSLANHMASNRFSIEECIRIAISIAEAIGEIHNANIIHKDINPANIVFNPKTNKAALIDFGLASMLTREQPMITDVSSMKGSTLAYMSPEQTGRMNRAVDYRADYYSFGITLFEMVTGLKPFEATDPLELVYCHIARKPKSPFEYNPDIPKVISDIVMKLLNKNAEDRYQSAWGIMADLKESLHRFEKSASCEPFPLAEQDTPSRLQIIQKLYGREKEIKILGDVLELACNGGRELALVTGYSGVGKTSLVREMYKQVTSRQGYFISGKFDQFQRNIPYSAIVGALQELVRQLLMESETRLAEWKETILNALGQVGQIVIDVIPEMELITGPQPSVPKLGPQEERNRFNLVFSNFIRVLSAKEHPLVLFLDDLQWIDGASLKLIELMILDNQTQYLFLIGAYRDNEVQTGHPLIISFDRLKEQGTKTIQIALEPLTLKHITDLLADSLFMKKKQVTPLAELITSKTGGNPFFLNTLLSSLHEDGLLEFDIEQRRWRWDQKQVEAEEIAADVVDLVARKITGLAKTNLLVLKTAACIGNRFDLGMLAEILDMTQKEIAIVLRQAISDGLIVPLGDAYKSVELDVSPFVIESKVEYRFAHDRIQQAAHSLIPEDERNANHLKIGRRLLSTQDDDFLEKRLFDVINQLNHGVGLIENEAERLELVRLNLRAGKKAKASAAYAPAFEYFRTASGLLEDRHWGKNYHLTLEVYQEAAEAAYLSSDFKRMEEYVETVLEQGKTKLDRIRVLEARFNAHMSRHEPLDAIELAITVLKEFGIVLPLHPSTARIVTEVLAIKVKLFGKKRDSLRNMPEMTDPEKIAAVRFMSIIGGAAYMVDPNILPIIACKNVSLALKYGNSRYTAVSYASLGLILAGAMGEIESAHEYTLLAFELLEKFEAEELRSCILFLNNSFVQHWRSHIKETLSPFLEGYKSGLEHGDFENGAYGCVMYCMHSVFIGVNLDKVSKEIDKYRVAVEAVGQEISLDYIDGYRQFALNLRGQSDHPHIMAGQDYDEAEMMAKLQKANNITAYSEVLLMKSILGYLFLRHGEALKYITMTEQNADSMMGQIWIPIITFFGSLIRLANYHDASSGEQRRYLRKVKANQKKMKKWAHHAPSNCAHRYSLVEAEKARVLGEDKQAQGEYAFAIKLAGENDYVHEQALAQELNGRFERQQGRMKSATTQMNSARDGYRNWGATAKVEHLEEIYPDLLTPEKKPVVLTADETHDSPSNSPRDTFGADLDLSTALKASRAISGEIVLARLQGKLMHAALENAGAEQGALILKRGSDLLVEVQVTSGEEPKSVLQAISLKDCSSLSQSIVRYVARTKETVVLGDAVNEGAFTHDDYIQEHRPLSILCLPFLHHGELSGIFYLENNLATHAFSSDRLDVLRLLASQAAISIENAKLYENLKQSEKKHRALMESMPDGVMVHSLGIIRFVNQKCVDFIGAKSADDLVGENVMSFVHPDYQKIALSRVQEAYNSKEISQPVEYKLIRFDGKTIEVEMCAGAVEYQGKPASQVVIRDISARKLAERQMFRAEKMASLGQIIAGVAHEINNPNNFIYFNLPILQKYIDSIRPLLDEHAEQDKNLNFLNMPYDLFIEDIYKLLDNMKHGSKRITDIVSDLKNYVRSSETEDKKPESVDGVVKQVMTLVGKQVRKDVKKLDVDVAEGLPMVKMNAGKIEQVLINLLINAGQAVCKDDSWLKLTAVSDDLNWVKILVEDNGSGIPEENLHTIFEPFFTTKADESGTGLGLAISYQILEDHNGTIDVESEVGKGTKFTIRLPVYQGSDQPAR